MKLHEMIIPGVRQHADRCDAPAGHHLLELPAGARPAWRTHRRLAHDVRGRRHGHHTGMKAVQRISHRELKYFRKYFRDVVAIELSNSTDMKKKVEGKVAWSCVVSYNAGSRNLSFDIFDISVHTHVKFSTGRQNEEIRISAKLRLDCWNQTTQKRKVVSHKEGRDNFLRLFWQS